ncbi:Methyltransferase domain-containing protein [Roseivivax lentus]|uniref:Methyltransferase domain-containing protein n=1 Tax=Roseivivax lentus TaxID=633194 RepID=A0A1N7PAN2_9RHOB|nr:class I SAM-dependent methyltransferase [Roseivivax lentus]SIT07608.1 Methyltransferase domain-containing protein [Roseivivax lentus]
MGFSADWLALREPADHAARDAALLRRAARAAGPDPVILDLGCGTGSTVRAMAPHLPAGTFWRLVDNDPHLLRRAADCAGGQAETWAMDLGDLEALPLEGVTLVTASALLDLMPEAWLRDLAARVRVPVYAALSYDGDMEWSPADAEDAAVTEAFNRHQRGDKGLGPALGPDAVETAASAFAREGFDVQHASSPWQLGPASAALQAALVEGIAAAAAEAGAASAEAWGAMRVADAARSTCRIGHGDILAMPPGAERNGAHATD